MTKAKREILQPITVMCVKISWSFFVMEGSGICGEKHMFISSCTICIITISQKPFHLLLDDRSTDQQVQHVGSKYLSYLLFVT